MFLQINLENDIIWNFGTYPRERRSRWVRILARPFCADFWKKFGMSWSNKWALNKNKLGWDEHCGQKQGTESLIVREYLFYDLLSFSRLGEIYRLWNDANVFTVQTNKGEPGSLICSRDNRFRNRSIHYEVYWGRQWREYESRRVSPALVHAFSQEYHNNYVWSGQMHDMSGN